MVTPKKSQWLRLHLVETIVFYSLILLKELDVQVGGFDLLIDQGSDNQAKCTSLASPVSLLGCSHDREKQLRQMANGQGRAQAQNSAT
jgi:hypothetical protein